MYRQRRTNIAARNKAPGHTSLNGSVARSQKTPRGTSTASSLSVSSGGSSPSSPALSSHSSPLRPPCLSLSPSRRTGCTSSKRSPFRRSCPRARGVCATRRHSRFLSPFFCRCHLATRFMRSIPCKHNVLCTPLSHMPALSPHMPSPALLHMPFILSLYFKFLYMLRPNCTCKTCTNNKTHTS